MTMDALIEKVIEDEQISDDQTNEENLDLEYEEAPIDQKRFTIDDDSKAAWAIDKINEAKAEIEKWTSYYKGALEKISTQQTNRIEYLRSLLRRYFETVPHKETKTQSSYPLPNGTLIVKRLNPKFDTNDEELLGWLKENGMTDFIKTETKEKPMWGELKKTVSINGESVVTADGEIVPGVTVIPQEDSFDIK